MKEVIISEYEWQQLENGGVLHINFSKPVQKIKIVREIDQ